MNESKYTTEEISRDSHIEPCQWRTIDSREEDKCFGRLNEMLAVPRSPFSPATIGSCRGDVRRSGEEEIPGHLADHHRHQQPHIEGHHDQHEQIREQHLHAVEQRLR